MFSAADKEQILSHGLTEFQVRVQLNNFANGFEPLRIDRAAVTGDGVVILDDGLLERYGNHYSQKSNDLKIVKFVPASGAGTRMFRELFEFVNEDRRGKGIDQLLENIERFAFYPALKHFTGDSSSEKETVEAIISDRGLGYGTLPKGLVLFHNYSDAPRTAADEHLVEGAEYAASGGEVNIHFTISIEHQKSFEEALVAVKPKYETRFEVRFNIGYSFQKSSTDTIAVTPDNEPFRKADGTLLFRPAGHGALLENLNDIDADIIYIKTLDNVLPDRLKEDMVKYKRALGGMLLEIQSEVFSLLKYYEESGEWVARAIEIIEDRLNYILPNGATAEDMRNILNRPLRVCGMVRNDGEPGGGPFWVSCEDGSESLQVVESSQIAPEQMPLIKKTTHFNPVDIVCGVKDYRGCKFDLANYVDAATGFISRKSQDGRALKAIELPGLWNGSMANWNTIFVEVPASTFSPVKVVQDLLREQHQ
jgi:hypothetical protein